MSSGGLSSTRPISSHFTHSLYTTGTLPAVALVAIPRLSGFVSPCGPFKWTLLRNQQFLPPRQPPTARGYEALSFQLWNPVQKSGPGARITHSQGIFPNFYPPHMEVGPSIPLLLLSPLRPIHILFTQTLWLCPSNHLDEYGFFKSLVVGFPYSSIFWQF